MALAIGILIIIILSIVILKWLKPYFLKYDHILFLTGQIGSGKTLTAVKQATTLLRKARFNHWWHYKVKAKWHNKYAEKKNKKIEKYNETHEKKKPLIELQYIPPRPQIYSNLPLHFKPHFWSRKKDKEWSCQLTLDHLTLVKEMAQDSIVIIDELPQFVNQFNWDVEKVQTYINEFITFFRHYYNGYIIMTAQATQDVVAQIRRKGNKATWCMNFRRHLFGLFYSIEMCDLTLNDQSLSINQAQMDDNTKKYFSLFPPKDTYDSRCYSERIQNAYIKLDKKQDRWKSLKTNKITRIVEYNSPLDDETTEEQKQKVYKDNHKKDKGVKNEK